MDLSIRRLKPQRVLPGPASSSTSAPNSFILATQSSQRTGLAAWATRLALMSSALVRIWAFTLATTGIWASDRVTLSSSTASFSAAGFMRVLWNGALTGRITAFLAPAAFSSSTASSTPLVAPAITIWPGQLKFTACTGLWPDTLSQISTILSRSTPIMAAMPPSPTGTASCM